MTGSITSAGVGLVVALILFVLIFAFFFRGPIFAALYSIGTSDPAHLQDSLAGLLTIAAATAGDVDFSFSVMGGYTVVTNDTPPAIEMQGVPKPFETPIREPVSLPSSCSLLPQTVGLPTAGQLIIHKTAAPCKLSLEAKVVSK